MTFFVSYILQLHVQVSLLVPCHNVKTHNDLVLHFVATYTHIYKKSFVFPAKRLVVHLCIYVKTLSLEMYECIAGLNAEFNVCYILQTGN